MAGPLERPEPASLRISDADRHRVAELLREAAGEGRLDIEELDQRLEAAYAAKTYAELVPITADLPSQGLAQPPAAVRGHLPASASYDSSLAIMSETKRLGPWVVPAVHRAAAFMGGVRLDLREATFSAPETVIVANAVMAGIDIVVDPYTHVVVEGHAIMGEFGLGREKVPAQLSPDSPVVRVKGFALMAGVRVVRKEAPGQGPRSLLRRG